MIALDGAGDRAALMLADRRHRPRTGHEDVCQHCEGCWPCDARRALDALSAQIEQAQAWKEHAILDCAMLGRIWYMTGRWPESGFAQTVRSTIGSQP